MSENKHAPVVLPQITKTQVMLALELVPTDMSHQEKCQWIADALNKSAASAPVALPQKHVDEMKRLSKMELIRYRVWPDGTVQEAWESPHAWMSDDYEYVEASSPEDAWKVSFNYFMNEQVPRV